MSVCKNCKQSLWSLMILAMMVDAGASVSPSPVVCISGQAHDFEEIPDVKVEVTPHD